MQYAEMRPLLWLSFALFSLYVFSGSTISEKEKTEAAISSTTVIAPAPAEEIAPSAAYAPIRVNTPMYEAHINPEGGDLSYLALKNYHTSTERDQLFVLFDDSQNALRWYVPKSGLMDGAQQGPDRPHQRALWHSQASQLSLEEDSQEPLEVVLTWDNEIYHAEKRLTFFADRHEIDVVHAITNHSQAQQNIQAFFDLRRVEPPKKKGLFGMTAYVGAAYNTEKKPYKKVTFEAIRKGKGPTGQQEARWISMQEHYFASAWVPEKPMRVYTRSLPTRGAYSIGLLSHPEALEPGETWRMKNTLYAGPEKVAELEAVAPDLELTLDYGFFWPVAQTGIWTLKHIESWVGNWGWSIVLLTLLVKLILYYPQSMATRSAHAMRKLEGPMKRIREQHGHDRQRLNQEMMSLYKKERFNPMSGCLIPLLQLPLSIGFYYMLLESVELRHAPFLGWYTDLSALDPYYLLPILDAASLFLVQKQMPAPKEAAMASMMNVFPLLFLLVATQCPAGLCLYWFVNNMVTALQQWMVRRTLPDLPGSTPSCAPATRS